MHPHLLLRVHTDLQSGLGRVARAQVLHRQWAALGGTCTLLVSGDEGARRMGRGQHPLLEGAFPFPVVDLGEDGHAGVPEELKAGAAIVLVDQGALTPDYLQSLRPLKVAVMEDDGDAHEQGDLLFQPFLDGFSWPTKPLKTVHGRKVRPHEAEHGGCRVLRGSSFVMVSPEILQLRPKREPLQPLAVHRLLVHFGEVDPLGLAWRAHRVLANLIGEGRWSGACTLVAPGGLDEAPFPGCRMEGGASGLSRRLQDFDAIWCTESGLMSEALCLGVPIAAWARDERQHFVIGDMALANGCYNLGIGPEADPGATGDALAQWLGPEGQETRQEQTRDGMLLVDGMGASRVVQELWALAQ